MSPYTVGQNVREFIIVANLQVIAMWANFIDKPCN